MTISYGTAVATESFFGMVKLLFRWKGSVFKLLLPNIIISFITFYSLQLTYIYALSQARQNIFEEVVSQCDKFNSKIPVHFVLGFYVSTVFGRWWKKFNCIPWPSKLSILIMSHIRGNDTGIVQIRRTLVRYASLSFLLTMCSISPAVKLRFPTYEHLTNAGFLLPHEQELLENTHTRYHKFYIPCVWAMNLLAKARLEGNIKDQYGMSALCDEVNNFRHNCLQLFNMDWVSIPLAYTQLVSFTVYMHTFTVIIGSLDVGQDKAFIFPIFAFTQIIFYNGWLLVGAELSNPFGSNDDDIEVNSIIDTYLQIVYLFVDYMAGKHVDLTKDRHWNNLVINLPYTLDALGTYNKYVRFGEAKFDALSKNMKIKKGLVEKEFDIADDYDLKQDGQDKSRRKSSLTPSLQSRKTWKLNADIGILKLGKKATEEVTDGEAEHGTAEERKKQDENSKKMQDDLMRQLTQMRKSK